MQLYRTRVKPLAGTRYADVAPVARALLREIGRRTRRQPYIRSTYFHKDKIFFTHFWEHLQQKDWHDRVRRLRFLPCAIDLLRHTRNAPQTKENPNKRDELLHRFTGITFDGSTFCVQIKENRKTDRKECMSVFPYI